MSRIAELVIADDARRWRALGFTVGDDGIAQVGTVRLRFVAEDGAVGQHVAVGEDREDGDDGEVGEVGEAVASGRGGGVVAWVLAGLPDEGLTSVDGLVTEAGKPT